MQLLGCCGLPNVMRLFILFNISPFLQILTCISHILKTDDEAEVRQAALVALKQLIKGVSQDILKVVIRLCVPKLW